MSEAAAARTLRGAIGKSPDLPRPKETNEMSNDQLIDDVNAELFWDPKLDNASIAVSADDGMVTLRGTVGTFREKREAKKAAERVYGVVEVHNELQVKLMTGARRDDAQVRGDVLQSLALDSIVPATIDASVDDGYVTLTGKAEWQYQRNEAEYIAANVEGVLDVENDVELVGPPPDADGVEHDIKRAFERNAKLDAKDLSIETSDHTVTVSGTVSSWAEHDEAIDAAWAAPGVRDVKDRIAVLY
jgi:osmotically-inducible protein OsmY